MADDNDKSPLTRRRVLGGMATVGVAGAVGAGTWSRFTDEENKQVTVSGGTLDLTIDGHNGETVEVEGGPLENGGTFEDCETLKNIGNVTGDNLRIELPTDGIVDYENAREEPEKEVDGSGGNPGAGNGELSDYLSIKGSLKCKPDEPCTPSASGAQMGYVPLTDAIGHGVEVPVDMGKNDTCELCFTVKLDPALEGNNANDAMSDSTQFDIDLTLEQNPSSGTSTSGGS